MGGSVRARRPAGVLLLALAGGLVTVLLAAGVRNPAGAAVGSAPLAAVDHSGHGVAQGLPRASQVALHDGMRKLWEDHVTWTRMAIVTFADGSAGFSASAQRLLQNQADIGSAIAAYYGPAAGARLTGLLHDHITIAVELLQAAKAGDVTAFTDARARWYANADQIAAFLASADPRSWPVAVVGPAMREHLDQTLAEASHELGGDYVGSVQDYDAIHRHILVMADLLSSGISRRFPERFH